MTALREKGLPAAAARRPIPPFTQEHEDFREGVRRFVETELHPHAREWEDARWFPNEVFERCAELGYLGLKYEEEYGIERVWRDMRLNRIGAGTDEVMLEVIGRSYGL